MILVNEDFEFYYQSTFQLASRRVRLLAFTIQILFEKELVRAKREVCDVSWVRVASNFFVLVACCNGEWSDNNNQSDGGTIQNKHVSKPDR